MTEDQKKNLESQFWGIANLLRGKISADDGVFRLDYILGIIFFKYQSKKQQKIADCLSSMGPIINKLTTQIEQKPKLKERSTTAERLIQKVTHYVNTLISGIGI